MYIATPQMNYTLGHQLKLSEKVPFLKRFPISGFHYKHQTGQHLHHCTGFYLWCPGQTHSRETEGGLSNFLHRSVQEAEQPKSNENLYFNSLLDGSKGCLTMNSKEKQTKPENSLFPLYEQHGFLSGELFYDTLRW